MPFARLRGEGVELVGLFYNPNIQPYTEQRRRLEALAPWAREQGLRLVVQDEYDPQAWLRQMVFRENQRCVICYHQRLTRAAQVARRGGFDAFTTTLLYSVQQKHELIARAAEAVAADQGVEFIYRDWRSDWRLGVEQSRRLELYRQAYCGCIYSERDRYLGQVAPGMPAQPSYGAN
jgi:predicted adenine nucleotide alpha hydrolase (AANH) superfamily ATPase